MASLQFEGDLSKVSEKQIQFIREVLQKRGYENNKVVFEPVGQAGDNYVANVQRVTVVVDNDDDFKMIAKIAPVNETLRQVMNTGSMFRNEIAMYEQVLSKFSLLQTAADLSEEEKFRYPRCYGCLSEEPNEVVLLEDLKVSDFVILDRFEPLQNDAVRLVLKSFARFHALSFALKKKEPGIYEILKSKLVDIWSSANELPQYKYFLDQVKNSATEILDDEKYKKIISELLDQSAALVSKMKKYEVTSKHLVVLQGDAWTNNLMFKLEGDQPSDCIMIDYQVSKEGNPAGDLLYMILCCTDHATRVQHYHDWISYYHDQLDKTLAEFGMKASFVYPRDQLDADLKIYSKLYFITSVVLYYFTTRKPEEAKDISNAMQNVSDGEMEMNKVSDNTAMMFKRKIEELVDSYKELGYLA